MAPHQQNSYFCPLRFKTDFLDCLISFFLLKRAIGSKAKYYNDWIRTHKTGNHTIAVVDG
jgi:hypothetical protein